MQADATKFLWDAREAAARIARFWLAAAYQVKDAQDGNC